MLKLTKTGIGLLTRQYRSVLKKCWAINVGLYGAMKGMATSAAAQMLSLLGSIGNGVAAGIDDVMLMFKAELAALMKKETSSLARRGASVRQGIFSSDANAALPYSLSSGRSLDSSALRASERDDSIGVFSSLMTGAIASGVFAAAMLMPAEAEALMKWCISNSASPTPLKLVAGSDACGDGWTEFGKQDDYKYYSLALGYQATASGNLSLALGHEANASNMMSMALGYQATASGYESIALGPLANAMHGTSMALGANATASGAYSVALGEYAYTGYKADKTSTNTPPSSTPSSAIAIGQYAGALTNSSIALGYNATAGQGKDRGSYTSAIAIGNSANASAENSVALGANSVANAENTVSVGSSSNTRKIVNVKAGTASTDAVNVSQLNTKQATLVSGTNIKTINGTSILGRGNISITDTNTTYSAGTGISISGSDNAIGVKLNSTYLETDSSGNIKAKYADSAGSVAWGNVSGKPTFATVATSGSYSDLSNKPSLGAAAAKNVDTTVTANSANLITSGGVATALNNYYRKENRYSGQVIDFTRYLKNIKLAEKERFFTIGNDNNFNLANKRLENNISTTFARFAKVPAAELHQHIANETGSKFEEMPQNSPTGEGTFLSVIQTHKNVMDSLWRKAVNDNSKIIITTKAA